MRSRVLVRLRLMHSYVAAIDQGTSSSRFVVYDAATLGVVASAQRKVRTATPQPGWAEQVRSSPSQASRSRATAPRTRSSCWRLWRSAWPLSVPRTHT